MEEIITRLTDMPTGTYGFTIQDQEGNFNVYINARMTSAKQAETYKHELGHIKEDELSDGGSVDQIELRAHS